MDPCRNAFNVSNEDVKFKRIATAARRHGAIEHRLAAVKVGITEAIGAVQQGRERRKRERLFGKPAARTSPRDRFADCKRYLPWFRQSTLLRRRVFLHLTRLGIAGVRGGRQRRIDCRRLAVSEMPGQEMECPRGRIQKVQHRFHLPSSD